MRLGHFFIERPIFATVLSILITIIGAISYFNLPVAQYPEIAPPTIQVTASYPGASAEVVANTVATPIEQEVNGVEGMLYMLSQSTADGQMALTVTFRLGTDLDQAQVLVQNRVARAEPRLPEEVRRLGVSTRKNSPDLMMVIHLLSPDDSRDLLYISNYATTQIVDRLARIDGVGQARVFSERTYSMRVWLDPERMAARNITAGEAVAALRANNLQVASGTLNQSPMPNQGAFELSVETRGRLVAPNSFGNIVIKSDAQGREVRVRDIARVELGSLSYNTIGYLGKNAALPIVIFQRPGSNALETAAKLISTMEELGKEFPPGLAYRIVYNPTEFIAQSVHAVFITIFEAIALVVLVMIVFLQSWRAAVIPILAIPISLVGTFAVMGALGFSINNLTLFGLVLSVGIVVDDAIVVVENAERHLRHGMSPRQAAHKTMDEVTGALIATSLVLLAVFVPAAYISGISGQFFRQFAVTIATATVFSLIVSLTLSPALVAILLRPELANGAPRKGVWASLGALTHRFSAAFYRGFDRLSDGYARLTGRLIRLMGLVLLSYVGLIVLAGYQFERTPTGFIPDQDQGYLITVIQLPPGASLTRTDAVIRKATDIILKQDGVENAVGFAGFDGASFTTAPNAGAIFVPMKPFQMRAAAGLTAERILAGLQQRLSAIKEANIFIVSPPPVRGLGSSGGFKLYVQDRRGRGLGALERATWSLAGAANAEKGLTRVFSLFNTGTPKLFVDVDRVKAEKLGVPPERIFEALEVYLGSVFINDFNFLGRTFRVTAQADAPYRRDMRNVAQLRARSNSGAMVPIGTVATFKDVTGPYRVARYNLFPSASLQGSALPGISTGQALDKVEQLARRVLPDGFSFQWTDLSYQEKQAGDVTLWVFAMAVTFVFLLLAALYESWLLPLAVILIVPMCLLTGITGVGFRGMDNNILTQIGLVVLVGLAAKNAILIVEFARQGEESGKARNAAVVEAARLRLRPILMTSFAFIIGVVPLVIATGAGAEMRRVLGTTVFSGMIGVTFFGLLFTPVFYVFCRWLGTLRRRGTARPETTGASAGQP